MLPKNFQPPPAEGNTPDRKPNEFFARTGKTPEDPQNLDLRINEWKVFENVLLVVKIAQNDLSNPSTLSNAVHPKTAGREIIEKLIADSNVEKLPKGIKIVAAVSDDVDLSSEMETIWGIFTRFDSARDVCFTRSTLANITPIYEGIMGIDATWKPGYPNPCVMSDEIIAKVDSRWKEYGFR